MREVEQQTRIGLVTDLADEGRLRQRAAGHGEVDRRVFDDDRHGEPRRVPFQRLSRPLHRQRIHGRADGVADVVGLARRARLGRLARLAPARRDEGEVFADPRGPGATDPLVVIGRHAVRAGHGAGNRQAGTVQDDRDPLADRDHARIVAQQFVGNLDMVDERAVLLDEGVHARAVGEPDGRSAGRTREARAHDAGFSRSACRSRGLRQARHALLLHREGDLPFFLRQFSAFLCSAGLRLITIAVWVTRCCRHFRRPSWSLLFSSLP